MRISAGELEARYETKHKLFDFFEEMRSAIWEHFPDKGRSWRSIKLSYLIEEMQHHIRKEEWVDVANLCFFLHDRERSKNE